MDDTTAQDVQKSVTDGYDQAQGRRGGFDIRSDANARQDLAGLAGKIGNLAGNKWGHNDAQIAQASVCATTAMLAGFYTKPPKHKPWANAELITITDQGVQLGDKKLEYEIGGRRYEGRDDGIVDIDDAPQESVHLVQQTIEQHGRWVKTQMYIKQGKVWEAQRAGNFDYFNKMGVQQREAHAGNVNNIIRRGNNKYKLRGVMNHPGIRRYTATANWNAGDPQVIYDEIDAMTNEFWASPTEENIPGSLILARRQHKYFAVKPFEPQADSTKLLAYVEDAYKAPAPGMKIGVDPGMATAGANGGAAALFYTNDPEMIICTAPMLMQAQTPVDVDEVTIRVQIWTYIFGVQVKDIDTVMVVEGEAAGWAGFSGQ